MTDINKAEIFLAGVQLISEQYEDVLSSGLVTGTMKMKINNLGKQCDKLNEAFFNQMDISAEDHHQGFVGYVEKFFEQ